ncbi:MAG: DUF6263 family protein [Planctomycetota bacterium]
MLKFIRIAVALAALVTVLLPTPALAQRADLSWKWIDGATSRYRMVESMAQSISGAASTDLSWVRTVEFTQTVESTSKGSVVSRTYDRVAVELDEAGKITKFDSDVASTFGNAAHPMIAPFTKMTGKILRVELDADSMVTGDDGPPELFEAMLGPLSQSNAGLAGLAPTGDQSTRLIEQTQSALDIIPGRRVRRGQSWIVDIPHAVPLTGDLASDISCTLKSARRNRASILIEGHLSQTDGESGLALLKLKEGVIEGTIEFDTEEGQIRKQQIEMVSEWSTTNELLEALGAEETTQSLRQSVELVRIR